MTEWRPIKDAPRDGTDILVWGKRCSHLVVYFDDMCPMAGRSHPWMTATGDCYAKDDPTHWMPLPDPPADK